MDKEALIGDSRSPKFLVCNLCNGRNHKAQQCPCKLCMVQWCQFQHLPTIFDVIIMSLGLDLDIIKITRAALSIGTQTIYSACLGLCNPEHARCLHDDFLSTLVTCIFCHFISLYYAYNKNEAKFGTKMKWLFLQPTCAILIMHSVCGLLNWLLGTNGQWLWVENVICIIL